MQGAGKDDSLCTEVHLGPFQFFLFAIAAEEILNIKNSSSGI